MKKVTFPLIVAFMVTIVIPTFVYANQCVEDCKAKHLPSAANPPNTAPRDDKGKLGACIRNTCGSAVTPASTGDTSPATTTSRKKKRGGNRINSGPARDQLELCAYDGMQKPADWCKEGCPALHTVDEETGICKPICEGFVCPSWYTEELERILGERDKKKEESLTFWQSNLDILLLAASALSILLLLIILGILIARRKKKDKTPPQDPNKPAEYDAATRDTTQLTPTK